MKPKKSISKEQDAKGSSEKGVSQTLNKPTETDSGCASQVPAPKLMTSADIEGVLSVALCNYDIKGYNKFAKKKWLSADKVERVIGKFELQLIENLGWNNTENEDNRDKLGIKFQVLNYELGLNKK